MTQRAPDLTLTTSDAGLTEIVVRAGPGRNLTNVKVEQAGDENIISVHMVASTREHVSTQPTKTRSGR